MRAAVVGNRDGPGIDRSTIQRGLGNAAAASFGIGDQNLEASGADSPRDRVVGPRRWNAGIDLEDGSTAAQSKNALQAGAIHPSGRAGVPGPAGASGVETVRV